MGQGSSADVLLWTGVLHFALAACGMGDLERRAQVAYKRKVELRPVVFGRAGIVTEGQRKPTFRLTGRNWAIYNVPSHLRGALYLNTPADRLRDVRLHVVGKRVYEYRIER